MKVIRWKNRHETGYMIRITEDEAWALLRSFANQHLSGNANVGRLESYTVDGEYFSVSLAPLELIQRDPPKKKQRRKT